MYNVKLWRVLVAIPQWKQQCILCVCVVVVVVHLNVTVSYIIILSVAQQCLYCKLMSLATKQIIQSSFERNYIPTNSPSFTRYIQTLN
jgi:hypothetical protein